MTTSFRAGFLFLAAAIGLTLIGSPNIAAKPDKEDPKKDKGEVLKTVIDVTLKVKESNPPVLEVTAVGQVPTGGWTDAKLTRRVYKKPPEDGIYEYDLTAVRPDGIVIQVISKVTATDSWKDPPKDLKGVKVYGTGDGAKTVKLREKR